MNQAQLEALLGRPLTTVEVTNLDLYLEIANSTLVKMLCTPIAPVDETRVFSVREGYRTAFLDIFRSVSEVKINGEVIPSSEYSLRQWDARTGSWFNSLSFKRRFLYHDTELEVTGSWGFAADTADPVVYGIPSDLRLVLAGLFSLVTKKNKQKNSLSSTVKSKKNEDFSITFADAVNLDEEFQTTYSSIISKYSLCNIGYVRHGEVRDGYCL